MRSSSSRQQPMMNVPCSEMTKLRQRNAFKFDSILGHIHHSWSLRAHKSPISLAYSPSLKTGQLHGHATSARGLCLTSSSAVRVCIFFVVFNKRLHIFSLPWVLKIIQPCLPQMDLNYPLPPQQNSQFIPTDCLPLHHCLSESQQLV